MPTTTGPMDRNRLRTAWDGGWRRMPGGSSGARDAGSVAVAGRCRLRVPGGYASPATGGRDAQRARRTASCRRVTSSARNISRRWWRTPSGDSPSALAMGSSGQVGSRRSTATAGGRARRRNGAKSSSSRSRIRGESRRGFAVGVAWPLCPWPGGADRLPAGRMRVRGLAPRASATVGIRVRLGVRRAAGEVGVAGARYIGREERLW